MNAFQEGRSENVKVSPSLQKLATDFRRHSPKPSPVKYPVQNLIRSISSVITNGDTGQSISVIMLDQQSLNGKKGRGSCT